MPSGPGIADENDLQLFNSLIYSAQRLLSITGPYFVPDESLLYASTRSSSSWASTVIRSWSTVLRTPEWHRRPLGKRHIDNVMRLTSALQ